MYSSSHAIHAGPNVTGGGPRAKHGTTLETGMNRKARDNANTIWQQLRKALKEWIHRLFVCGSVSEDHSPYTAADILGVNVSDEHGPWHDIPAAGSIQLKDKERSTMPTLQCEFLRSVQFLVFESGNATILTCQCVNERAPVDEAQ